MKISDRIALGTVAGILGTIPQLILNYISVQMGFAKTYAFQLSGGIYLFKRFTAETAGFIFGGIVWLIVAAGLGIITTYIIVFTGKDYWWLKGILVSNFIMYVAIYGIIFTLGGAKVVPFDIPTNASILIENVVFGITTAYLVIRLGYNLEEKRL